MGVLAVLLALVAAALFAVATVLQQRGAMQEQTVRAGFLVRLARKPVWLLGVLADAAGYVAQGAALGVGRLVVVQPLLVASVVFALPLGVRFTGQRVGRRELLGAVAVCAGLAVFMVLASPSGGEDDASTAGWIAGGAVVAVAAAALIVAAVGRRPAVKAALLGTAAGIVLGLVAALTKATVDRFGDGVVAVVADWHVYGLLSANLLAFLLIQLSLQTGALAPSIATTMVFETIAGVAVGIALLHEELHEAASGTVASLLALVGVLAGVVALSGAGSD